MKNLVALMMAVIVVSSCSGLSGGAKVHQEGAVYLLVAGASDGGATALIAGELVIGEGGCISVESNEGSIYVLVWPRGSVLQGEDTIVAPTGGLGRSRTYRIGDDFTGGGGYYSPPIYQRIAAAPEVPVGCDPNEVAMIDSIAP